MSAETNFRDDKSFDDDLYMVKYLYRPLSQSVSKHLDLNPNIITGISFLSVTVGCFCLLQDRLILSVTFIFLWQLLDHIDGDVAHLWNRKSKLGDYYDTITCYSAVMLLGITLSIHLNEAIGFIFAITYLLSRLLYQKLKNYHISVTPSEQTNFKKGHLRLIAQVRREITSPSGFLPFLILLEVALLDQFLIFGFLMIADHSISILYLIKKAQQLDT